MSMAPTLPNWVDLFGHFASLSLLAVGGAITTAPDMHRYLVHQNAWLSDAQFSSSIALSQAAPGPNVLFVALLGWNVGLNAGGGPGGDERPRVRRERVGQAPLRVDQGAGGLMADERLSIDETLSNTLEIAGGRLTGRVRR